MFHRQLILLPCFHSLSEHTYMTSHSPLLLLSLFHFICHINSSYCKCLSPRFINEPINCLFCDKHFAHGSSPLCYGQRHVERKSHQRKFKMLDRHAVYVLHASDSSRQCWWAHRDQGTKFGVSSNKETDSTTKVSITTIF